MVTPDGPPRREYTLSPLDVARLVQAGGRPLVADEEAARLRTRVAELERENVELRVRLRFHGVEGF